MSDQTKWMPDAERLCMAVDLSDQAWEEISDGERGPDGSWLDPLRAVVREAVEKALAEQMDLLTNSGRLCPADGLTYDGLLLKLEMQEARHKRYVLEVRIYECEKYGDCICERYSDPTLNVRHRDCEVCKHLDSLRSELAALDKEVSHE